MAPPRKVLPELKTSPQVHPEQDRALYLREQIQNNRTRWLAIATKSPLTESSQLKLMGGSVSSFAVIAGLATVITVAAGLAYNEAGKATKFTQVPAAPAITKAADAPKITKTAAKKAAEAPAVTQVAETKAAETKAAETPEIIKAEDSPADVSSGSKKTIVSRIAQE